MTISKEEHNSFMQVLMNEKAFIIMHVINSGSVGDYTKHYETWRRGQNIIKCFKEELTKKDGQVKVLDIGCDNGLYIFLLNSFIEFKNMAYFYGIDISPCAIYLAEEFKKTLGMNNVTFEVGDAEDLKLQSSYFDIVIGAELIEHLTNPDNFLGQLIKVLKPGGLAIITTPNKNNLVHKLGKIPLFFFKNWKPASRYGDISKPGCGYGHISVKGLNEWIKIIKWHGFEIEGIKRGSLFFGGAKYDAHPLFFAISLILEIILDYLPFTHNLTENITFKLRKPYSDKQRC